MRFLILLPFISLCSASYKTELMDWAQDYGTNCTNSTEDRLLNDFSHFELGCLTLANPCHNDDNDDGVYFFKDEEDNRDECIELMDDVCQKISNLPTFGPKTRSFFYFCCQLVKIVPVNWYGKYSKIDGQNVKAFCHTMNVKHHVDFGIITETERRKYKPTVERKEMRMDDYREVKIEKTRNESFIKPKLPRQGDSRLRMLRFSS